MLKNYFKTAWRSLMNNKFYSGINIFGLAIGLAIGIMLLLWVDNELSFDGFHKNVNSIYKINSHIGTGTSAQVWGGSPGPMAVFSKQVPEIVNAARIKPRENDLSFKYGNNKFQEKNAAFVDPSFFKIFTFPLEEGSIENPFPNDHSIVITRSVAKKYFNDADPIGKALVSGNENFVVSGVAKDLPKNSSIQYDVLFPMSLFARNFGGNGQWKTIDEDLGNYFYWTALQLQPSASAETVGKKLSHIYQSKRADDKNAQHNYFTLQSLSSIHLVTEQGNSAALQTVRIFLLVALLTLAIACINYVNLSTARAILRSKEVSVRKIIGAARKQLFLQFIIETTLLFFFASLLCIFTVYLLLPLYNNLSGKQLQLNVADMRLWMVIGTSIVATLALSAIYPALQLSSFSPINALRGKISTGIRKTSFRKVLVVTQFVFSIALIIATIVISRQLKYVRNKDLGFDKEYVFSFGLTGNMHDHFEAIRTDLLKQPGILAVGSADGGVAGTNGTTGDTYWDGKEPDRMFLVNANGIDKDLIPTLKIRMALGSNFTGEAGDSAHIILNETAVRQAGIKNPIGKSFTLWQTKGTIIGVVKDYNYESLKTAIAPAVYYYTAQGGTMYVKTSGTKAQEAIASTEKTWKTFNAENPFEYTFLDDDFNKMYTDDQRTGTLFNTFAVAAIVISCLGLFGLATYTAQVKTKEIGIRKVLGASISSITGLLAREFVMLILIAFVIASPIAWYFMNKWLGDFVYRIHINSGIFLLTGLLALGIAVATVGVQALKAAVANPAKSLRAD